MNYSMFKRRLLAILTSAFLTELRYLKGSVTKRNSKKRWLVKKNSVK